MNAKAVRETPLILFPEGLECRIRVEGERHNRSFAVRCGNKRVLVRVWEQRFRSRHGDAVTVIEVSLSGCTLITPRDEFAPRNTVRWTMIGRSAPWFFRPGPDCRMDEIGLVTQRHDEGVGTLIGI
jgi:hypothetical protein